MVAIVFRRWYQFYKYLHIPGPDPSFLFGNYHALLAKGWGGRHTVIAELHEQYGPVFHLYPPLFKRTMICTNKIADVSTFDYLRVEKLYSQGT